MPVPQFLNNGAASSLQPYFTIDKYNQIPRLLNKSLLNETLANLEGTIPSPTLGKTYILDSG